MHADADSMAAAGNWAHGFSIPSTVQQRTLKMFVLGAPALAPTQK